MKRRTAAFRLLGVGWYIALSIVLGVGVGYWLDHKFGTGVILTLIGLFLGLALAAYGAYEMLAPLFRDKSDDGEDKN